MIRLEKVKNVLLVLLLALFTAALILFPSEAADAARQGLVLCFRTVLPSLFPFFVLSSLFVATGAADAVGRVLEPVMRPLFYLSGAGASALVLGLVGGYPVGARTTAELYRGGSLAKAEAERLLSFCNNAGPGFILGICGGAVFGSVRAGLYLYLVHVAAAVLAGVALRRCSLMECDAERSLRRRRGNASSSKASRSSLAAFPACVRDSFAAVWSVCGFVVLFAVVLRFAAMLLPAGAEGRCAYPLLLGFVELTNGVMALASDRGGFVLCAALLAWGGLSVHAQTLSVLEGTDLSPRLYFLGKAAQTALSVPLALLVSALL